MQLELDQRAFGRGRLERLDTTPVPHPFERNSVRPKEGRPNQACL
jgi:hypothetical protein